MVYEEPLALAKIEWNDLTSGERHEFILMEGATATIGRSKDNNICVPERHVSRRHAVIHYRDGIFMLSDLGSANGTFVNNEKLDGPFPLAGGDVIRLFVPELRFVAGVTEEEQESASQGGTLIMPAVTEGRCPYVVVTSGPQEGTEFPFLSEIVTVGRATSDATWEICLQDRAVSRPHARFERLSGADGWRLVDLRSANGTRVNGKYLDPETEHLLRDGDVLVFGSSMLLFRQG